MEVVQYIILLSILLTPCHTNTVDFEKTLVWGPGLNPVKNVLPTHYFFIHPVGPTGKRFFTSTQKNFQVNIHGKSKNGICRTNLNYINREDGSIIVQYKLMDWCDDFEIRITYNSFHVAKSPYFATKRVYPHSCYCPQDLSTWLLNNECPSLSEEKQIQWDLHLFKHVNFTAIRKNILKRYNSPNSISLCHYVVKLQEIWRTCYEMEFYLNIGDWPLSVKGGQQRTSGPYPIFSWCGSDSSYDIVLPTYDITESSLESMSRVTLDMISVQQNRYPWEKKEEIAFFRGRDSRKERLKLIDMAKKFPDMINASITNFFFFRDEVHKYGPKEPPILFTEFFKYKYQLNIDGSVAAYRLPYLLAGGSLVFKQESQFYEHFYSKLVPYQHFVPLKQDLNDVIEKIKWARENDLLAKKIASAAKKFVENNLLPQNIYCYHLTLFKEWSRRIISPIIILPGMEKINKSYSCSCKNKERKDEL